MKKFKFRLEVVLKERKRMEDFKFREWATAKKILNMMKDSKAKLENRLLLAIDEASYVASSSKNSIGSFQIMDNFIEGTKLQIIWKTQEIERGEKLTERKRLEYVEASKKRQSLEKLKEKRNIEFKDAARKREYNLYDDIYIMRARMNQVLREEDSK